MAKNFSMYKPFKMARSFTVQYFGICIPKNAIYGRLTRNIYIYVDNYKQFRINMDGVKSVNVYLLDARKDSCFKNCVIKPDNAIFKLCYDYVSKNKLWNVVCENNLCFRKSGVRPQWFVKKEYNKRGYGDNPQYIGTADDMRFKERTTPAHYAHESASMVGCGIVAAQKFDAGMCLIENVKPVQSQRITEKPVSSYNRGRRCEVKRTPSK